MQTQNWIAVKLLGNKIYIGSAGGIKKSNWDNLAAHSSGGYIMISLAEFGISKKIPAHRLIATAFIGNPENKKHINHKNGDKADNRAVNLEWCTDRENQNHAFKTGLIGTIKIKNSLGLSDDALLEIYDNKRGDTLKYFSEKYSIETGVVWAIQTKHSWLVIVKGVREMHDYFKQQAPLTA